MIIKGQMLFPREAADGQRLGYEPISNGASLAIKGLIQPIIKDHGAQTHHGELRRDRSIRFHINDYIAHENLGPRAWTARDGSARVRKAGFILPAIRP